MMRNHQLTVACISVAQILSMLPFAAYPALIPELQTQWAATSTEIGWVAGIYFGGYLVAVGVLVSSTDLIDARKIYLWSMAIGIAATLGFAFFTSGVATASFWRCLQGIALAGTYMPGLKALVDNAPEHSQSRTVAAYTACFGVGVGVSFLATGHLATLLDWEWVFVSSAAGPACAFGLALILLPTAKFDAERNRAFRWLPDFREVIRNRIALGFSIAYGAHNMELFVFRSWMVAFAVFTFGLYETETPGANWNPAIIVAIISFMSQPFSVLTNEIANRFDRTKVILWVMAGSAVFGVALGFSSSTSIMLFLCLAAIYGILCMSDSASITAAVVKSADARLRGATLALHSLIGFAGAFIGPILFGMVLDFFGEDNTRAWGFAFVAMAAVGIIGPAAVFTLSRKAA